MTPAPIILSLGAGVQSTAMTLAAIDGHLPKPDHVVFADTGWEPKRVYEHLARLRPVVEAAGITFTTVSVGNIRADALDPDHRFASMPLYVKGAKGNGMVRRQCTSEYKLKPIKAHARRILGAQEKPNGQPGRVPGRRWAWNWVGISTDEFERITTSDVGYLHRDDPLVTTLNMSRDDCLAYLADRWPHPVGRSACIGCPFRNNAEWRDLRDNEPSAWADAIAFDRAIRNGGRLNMPHLNGEAFLHSDRVPLGDANIERLSRRDRKALQGQLFVGCNPFGCAREAVA